MKATMHRYILHNDSIRDAAEPCLTPGQVGLLAGWGVFSTLRVNRGVLFEWERHFARMRRDARNLAVPFPEDPDWMHGRLLELVRANDAPDATLRVVVIRNKGGVWQGPVSRDFDLLALMTNLTNWGDSVRLGVVPQGRHSTSRFAGTKVTAWGFNLTWYEEAHANGFDEVVLLDEHDRVSECTSANIFAAFATDVCTPPLSSGCLPGVTRDVLLNELRVPEFRVVERQLTLTDLEVADEVFITSTTRDVLHVREINGRNTGATTQASTVLRSALRAYIDAYVASRTSAGTVVSGT
jgi:branched-chain amino acid aminotransferase